MPLMRGVGVVRGIGVVHLIAVGAMLAATLAALALTASNAAMPAPAVARFDASSAATERASIAAMAQAEGANATDTRAKLSVAITRIHQSIAATHQSGASQASGAPDTQVDAHADIDAEFRLRVHGITTQQILGIAAALPKPEKPRCGYLLTSRGACPGSN